jgi:hypothetical protein
MYSNLCRQTKVITDRNAGYVGLKLGQAKFVLCDLGNCFAWFLGKYFAWFAKKGPEG